MGDIADYYTDVVAAYPPDDSYEQDDRWVTREGQILDPQDMTDAHILNVIRIFHAANFPPDGYDAVCKEADRRNLDLKPILDT